MIISPTKSLPLSLQLHDGNTGKFPLAHVMDETNTPVTGSPFSLSHVSNGFYSNLSYTVLSANKKLKVTYITYNEIGHTTESIFHTREFDMWDVETQVEVAQAELDARIGAPTGASISADIAAVQTKLGTPAGASVSADIASVQTTDNNIYSRIGAPVGASISADIAAVKSDMDSSFTAVQTKLGTPVGISVSADIAGIQTKLGTPASATVSSDVANIYSRIGAPVGLSISADIASVQTTDNNIYSRIGAPAGLSVSADIASVKTDTTKIGNPAAGTVSADLANIQTTDNNIYSRIGVPNTTTIAADLSAIKTDMDSSFTAVQTKLGTPAGLSVSADIASIQTTDNNIYSRIGAPVGASISADIVSVKSDTNGLRTDYTTARAVKIDFLDAAVTSRLSTSHFDTIAGVPVTSISGDIATIIAEMALLTPANIGNYVWNAARIDHAIPGTFGIALQGEFNTLRASYLDIIPVTNQNLNTLITDVGIPVGSSIYADIAAMQSDVDIIRAKTDNFAFDLSGNVRALAQVVADKTGYSLSAGQQTALVSATWGEPLAGYTVSGTAGKTLADAALSVSPAAIGAAVWDITRAAHVTVGSFGESLQGVLSTARAAKIDFLDAAISTLETESSAGSRYSLLSSSLSTINGTANTISSKLGTPAGVSVSADIAAVKSDTTKIGTPSGVSIAADISGVKNDTVKIGTPAGVSVSADIAAVQTKLGLPAGVSVSADIAAVKTDTIKLGTPAGASVSADIASVQSKLGTPAGLSVSADIAAVGGTTAALSAVVGTPTGASLAIDISNVKVDTTTLTGRLTPTRAANLDNLNASITSRVAQAGYNTDITTINTKLDGIQAAIGAIPNNTSAVVIVPPIMIRPLTGSVAYKFFVNLFDITTGVPVDADAGITLTIKTVNDVVVVGATAMTHIATGQYSYSYTVNSIDTEQSLYVFFNYSQNTIPFQQVRVTDVQEWESKLDTLLTRLTPTRATNLDFLDASVSSRSIEANSITREAAVLAAIATLKSDLDSFETIFGIPVGPNFSADYQAIKAQVDKIGNPSSGTLAGDVALVKYYTDKIGVPLTASVSTDIQMLLSRIGSPTISLVNDIASVKSDTTKIGNPANITLSTDIADIRNKMGVLSGSNTLESEINNINMSSVLSVIGTPVNGTVSADIVAVQTKLGNPASGSVSSDVSFVKADTTKIGLPASGTVSGDIAAVQTKLGTPAGLSVSADIAAVKSDTAGIAVANSGIATVDAKIGTPIGGSMSIDLSTVNTNILARPVNPVLQNDSRMNYLDVAVSSRATPANIIGSVQGLDLVEIYGTIDDDTTGEIIAYIEAA